MKLLTYLLTTAIVLGLCTGCAKQRAPLESRMVAILPASKPLPGEVSSRFIGSEPVIKNMSQQRKVEVVSPTSTPKPRMVVDRAKVKVNGEEGREVPFPSPAAPAVPSASPSVSPTDTPPSISVAIEDNALPTATFVDGKPHLVKSPYTGQYVHIGDLPPGSVAKDPYSGKPFLIPIPGEGAKESPSASVTASPTTTPLPTSSPQT